MIWCKGRKEGLPNIWENTQIFSPYMRRSLDFAPDPSEFPNILYKENFISFFIIVILTKVSDFFHLASHRRGSFSYLRFPIVPYRLAYGFLSRSWRWGGGSYLPFSLCLHLNLCFLLCFLKCLLTKYFIVLWNRFKTNKRPNENPKLPMGF